MAAQGGVRPDPIEITNLISGPPRSSDGGQRTGAPADGVQVVKRDQRTRQTTQTAGFDREELISTPGAWIGVTRTPPGSTSAWHHHGDYDTYIYLLAGEGRLEYGPGGRESCTGEVGDLVFIPKGVIHREANTGAGDNEALIVRIGTCAPVFIVDGPAT